LNIISLDCPANCLLQDESVISLCLERGSKTSETNGFLVQRAGRHIQMHINEILEVDATLYYDKKSRYESKRCFVAIREWRTDFLGRERFKTLGRCPLSLDTLLESVDGMSREGTFVFEILRGVVLKVLIDVIVLSTQVTIQDTEGEDGTYCMSPLTDITVNDHHDHSPLSMTTDAVHTLDDYIDDNYADRNSLTEDLYEYSPSASSSSSPGKSQSQKFQSQFKSQKSEVCERIMTEAQRRKQKSWLAFDACMASGDSVLACSLAEARAEAEHFEAEYRCVVEDYKQVNIIVFCNAI
jgi:hypothetical protein